MDLGEVRALILVITLRPASPPRRSAPPLARPFQFPTACLQNACTPQSPQRTSRPCPDCQPRVRRILHALCHAAEAKNYTVSYPETGSAASLVIR